MNIRFYDLEEKEINNVSIVVIFAMYQGKWLVCKHEGRNTFECPGGHVELHENILDAACRELYEESGALEYEIVPICKYSFVQNKEETFFAQLFFANIKTLGSLPHFEIESIEFTSTLNLEWTYPKIQQALIDRINQFIL